MEFDGLNIIEIPVVNAEDDPGYVYFLVLSLKGL